MYAHKRYKHIINTHIHISYIYIAPKLHKGRDHTYKSLLFWKLYEQSNYNNLVCHVPRAMHVVRLVGRRRSVGCLMGRRRRVSLMAAVDDIIVMIIFLFGRESSEIDSWWTPSSYLWKWSSLLFFELFREQCCEFPFVVIVVMWWLLFW